MLTFFLELTFQTIACLLGFLAGIMYERDRLKRQKPHQMNNAQNPAQFRAGKVWYRETPRQDISDEI